MGISIANYGEAASEIYHTINLLEAALRQTEDASRAVDTYSRKPTQANKDMVFATSISDVLILNELVFQCFVNLSDIRDELKRLADERLKIQREGA
ncbi:hypothetical protein [Secundilactobacillus odoratitofui]|uniref:hypothetical protein n=1 Tax=Secundilactobacillus odoratitofui TaxID=480930 RepID=UPI0006D15B73|nr:hypothetical protein [Secundilactobacillus odoratitofui]